MSPESLSNLIVVIASMVILAGSLAIAVGALYHWWRSRSAKRTDRRVVMSGQRPRAPSDTRTPSQIVHETPAQLQTARG